MPLLVVDGLNISPGSGDGTHIVLCINLITWVNISLKLWYVKQIWLPISIKRIRLSILRSFTYLLFFLSFSQAHSGCFKSLMRECDMGPIRELIIPPWAVSMPVTMNMVKGDIVSRIQGEIQTDQSHAWLAGKPSNQNRAY